MTYEEFVASKVQSVKSVGIPSPGPISSALSPFQVDCVRFALERGRAALWLARRFPMSSFTKKCGARGASAKNGRSRRTSSWRIRN